MDLFNENFFKTLIYAVNSGRLSSYHEDFFHSNPRLMANLNLYKVRQLFCHALDSKHPAKAVQVLRDIGFWLVWAPCIHRIEYIDQPGHHIGNVWRHTKLVLNFLPMNIYTRTAALFHDTGKYSTRTVINGKAEFPEHDRISIEITKEVLKKMQFHSDFIKDIIELMQWRVAALDYSQYDPSYVLRYIPEEFQSDVNALRYSDDMARKIYNTNPEEFITKPIEGGPENIKEQLEYSKKIFDGIDQEAILEWVVGVLSQEKENHNIYSLKKYKWSMGELDLVDLHPMDIKGVSNEALKRVQNAINKKLILPPIIVIPSGKHYRLLDGRARAIVWRKYTNRLPALIAR